MNALRGRPLAALGAAVLLAHLWVVGEVLPSQLGEGAALRPLRRIEVAFVSELKPTAPPPRAVPVVAPLRRVPKAVAAALPASAPTLLPPPPEPAPEPPPEPPQMAASAPEPAASAAPVLAAASAPDTAASAAQPAFEWPPSTRLSYRLTGNARGPVEGYARVEWLRAGTRYQVLMEASIGPPFAPLYVRRDSSEGEITPEGLSPRRYVLETKVVLRDPRREEIQLDEARIRLPNGRELARPPGVQDGVSQFVHMTWLFTMDPQRLTPGRSVDLMLALPRRVEPWTYDVVGNEPLDTRFGRVDAVHVKPRREARPGDFAAEMWVAPTLQYLPVRIVVRQDAENYIDLQIDRLPEQAAPGR